MARCPYARGVRVWSVVLGNANPAGVTPFSDDVWQLDPDGGDVPGFVRWLDWAGTRPVATRRVMSKRS